MSNNLVLIIDKVSLTHTKSKWKIKDSIHILIKMIEVKSGETYNGTLEEIDKFMNISIIDAVETSRFGDLFKQIPRVLIKGI